VPDVGALAAHHPFWVVALIVTPIVIAAWDLGGSLLLESRHEDEMFGGRES
jgi:hypothetical protein